MSLGLIIESYEFISEHKRVVELPNGDTQTTRMKIYRDNNSGEFHPHWEHSVQQYVDANPQTDPKYLISYWENKIISANSSQDFGLQSEY